jgi:isopenicillin-N epimerase
MNSFAALWPLDPQLVFLNHGSFGSCPLQVLEQQDALRRRLERQPVQFLVRELEPLLDAARARLAAFVGAAADDLVLVPNATYGVNSVLRSLRFEPGDELLVTDHEYNACRNALDFVAERSGARVVTVALPFPLQSPRQVVDAVLAAVTPRTRLLLIDHVSSQTALVLPLAPLVAALNDLGIDTLVDGAHAPGMIALDIDSLGAAYYTGNCHKWLCAPKGAGFLHVRADRQQQVRPLAISHGANSTREDRSRLQIEFGWTGTWDPSAMLCIPAAIDCLAGMLPGGWPALMAANRALALQARALLCTVLGIEAPCPESMVGAMSALPIADSLDSTPARSALYQDPLQDRLLEVYGIEVPVIPWPSAPRRLLRISAQLYNEPAHYRLLADALAAEKLSPC